MLELVSAYVCMCNGLLHAIKDTALTFWSGSPLRPPRCIPGVCNYTCNILLTRATYPRVWREIHGQLCACTFFHSFGEVMWLWESWQRSQIEWRGSKKSNCLLLLLLDIWSIVFCVVYLVAIPLLTAVHVTCLGKYSWFLERHTSGNYHPEQNTVYCSLCLNKCSPLIQSLRAIAVCENTFLAGFPRVYTPKKVVRLEQLFRCIETELALITRSV